MNVLPHELIIKILWEIKFVCSKFKDFHSYHNCLLVNHFWNKTLDQLKIDPKNRCNLFTGSCLIPFWYPFFPRDILVSQIYNKNIDFQIFDWDTNKRWKKKETPSSVLLKVKVQKGKCFVCGFELHRWSPYKHEKSQCCIHPGKLNNNMIWSCCGSSMKTTGCLSMMNHEFLINDVTQKRNSVVFFANKVTNRYHIFKRNTKKSLKLVSHISIETMKVILFIPFALIIIPTFFVADCIDDCYDDIYYD